MKVITTGIVNVACSEGVVIIEPSNLYDCSIGANSFVGPFCEIQSGVVIGSQTRVQSHTFICSQVSIGDDCFVGHGVVFVNDTFSDGKPARGDKSKWKSTSVENRVYIGSNATILPVKIVSDVVIGAGSVVTNDILSPGKYAGNPAKMLK